jgi:hypothetical protein
VAVDAESSKVDCGGAFDWTMKFSGADKKIGGVLLISKAGRDHAIQTKSLLSFEPIYNTSFTSEDFGKHKLQWLARRGCTQARAI